MDKVLQILEKFAFLARDIIPYFIIGTLAGAALKSWLPFSVVERYLGRGLRSMMAVSIFGGMVPVCSCSMVPVAQAMKEKGAALGAVVAFLIVAPVLSPVTVFLTWGWLGPGFTVARIIAAFAGALAAGTLLGHFSDYPTQDRVSEPGPRNAGPVDEQATSGAAFSQAPSCSCSCECKTPGALVSRSAGFHLRLFWSNFVMILKDLWVYLLIGVAASAIVSVLVPKDLLPKLVGNGLAAYLLAAGAGVPVYVCSGEEIPIAKALLDINLPAGATFTFLLSATGVCLPTILMASKFLGRKNAVLYALFWFVFSICAGLVFSLVR
jgi:hypothetical protein